MAHPLLRTLASLKLTLALLAGSFLLVFFGTLDQVNWGIHEVQRRYFQSWIAFWAYPDTWPLGTTLSSWLRIPLMGGYGLGSLLLLNLMAASRRIFQTSWRKAGILCIHVGVLVLLIAGFASSILQQEYQMWLSPNTPTAYAEDTQACEIALIDTIATDHDTVWAIPLPPTQAAHYIHPTSHLKLTVDAYYPNADIAPIQDNPGLATPIQCTQGVGKRMNLGLYPKPVDYSPNASNIVAAYVTVANIGTFLVSTVIDERFPPQSFEYEGHTYTLALRLKRHYFPFTFTLKHFTHEKHPGSEIPKDFSSRVILHHPTTSETREVLIYMNNPLRYQGFTFYQASFSPDGTSSMLQVVQNPSRSLPYIALILVGVGMLYHFGYQLVSVRSQARP